VQKHSSVSTFVAAAVKVTEKKTSDEAKTAKNLKKSTKMEETGDGGEKPQELSKKFQKAMTTAEKAVKEAEKSMKIAQKAMKTAAKEAKKED
jgi:hypothetical protein